MPVTSPAALTKIKSEFGAKSSLSTNTYNSGSGSITAPSGAKAVRIKVWGGGGGGLWVSNPNVYYGGGGGGFILAVVPVTGGSTSVSYSVGSGGTASAFFATNGSASTVTIGSTTYTANGGQAGQSSSGGAGGTASNGDINETGDSGTPGYGGNAAGMGFGGGEAGSFSPGSSPGGGGGGWDGNVGSNTGNAGGAGQVILEWLDISSNNNLSAFVRGGSYVPNNGLYSDISALSTGLAISQFNNKSKKVLSLPSGWSGSQDIVVIGSMVDTTGSGAVARAILIVKAGGSIARVSYYDACANPVYLPLSFTQDWDSWISEGSTSGVYVYLSGTGDTPDGSSINTLLDLSSDQQWSLCVQVPAGSGSSKTFTGTLSLRDASSNVIVSKTIAISVDATSSEPC